jgi:hypothetical protein
MTTKTTETVSQKEVAQALDIAAKRAYNCDATPASAKQCWFLASLFVRIGRGAEMRTHYLVSSHEVLTSRKASQLINQLLQEVA